MKKKRYEDGGEVGTPELDKLISGESTGRFSESDPDVYARAKAFLERGGKEEPVSKPKQKARVSDFGSFQRKDKMSGVSEAKKADAVAKRAAVGRTMSQANKAANAELADMGRKALDFIRPKKASAEEQESLNKLVRAKAEARQNAPGSRKAQGYAKGGAVRGAGMASKGVRKCKIC